MDDEYKMQDSDFYWLCSDNYCEIVRRTSYPEHSVICFTMANLATWKNNTVPAETFEIYMKVVSFSPLCYDGRDVFRLIKILNTHAMKTRESRIYKYIGMPVPND